MCKNQEILLEILYINQTNGEKTLSLNIKSCKTGSTSCSKIIKILNFFKFNEDNELNGD